MPAVRPVLERAGAGAGVSARPADPAAGGSGAGGVDRARGHCGGDRRRGVGAGPAPGGHHRDFAVV